MEINMVYVIHSLVWPLIACLFWWWNELWYVTSVRARCKLLNAKLPPGHLGVPIFGEYFTFLWYFHFLHRPDRFITSKMDKYGKNVGAYKTFLYGSPAIIACSPSLCKRILTSTTGFKQGWPSSEVLGSHSVITIHGSRHQLIKGLLSTEFNHRDALSLIAQQVQPCIVAALHSWSQIGQINTFFQTKRVALEFMARYMASLEIAPEIDDLEELFSAVTEGIRAQPWNFPGTPYRHALQEENMEMAKEKNAVDVTYEDFLRLKYTNQVVEETNRIASLSGFLFKQATEDIKFEGYLIPKGWNVLLWLRYLHIDPKNFEDPMTFNPDRWESRPKHGTYLPFGGGTRTCPGSMLVHLITTLFLHHLVVGYRWELANPDMPIIYLSHPVPADGVEILVSRV
ncbi:ent-kaurenoic acid oxidase-like isoform X3 [Silene latifolia]|uniref:ent-kaurenoic acid oxidase-like isoform X3 n=1 Tax=Silene latifolia TaxID=37657 RepID=UPI003D774423